MLSLRSFGSFCPSDAWVLERQDLDAVEEVFRFPGLRDQLEIPDAGSDRQTELVDVDHSSEEHTLTLGQIHSALAYYWDHAEELDREIERSLEFADQLRRSAGPSPLRARLKAKGLL